MHTEFSTGQAWGRQNNRCQRKLHGIGTPTTEFHPDWKIVLNRPHYLGGSLFKAYSNLLRRNRSPREYGMYV